MPLLLLALYLAGLLAGESTVRGWPTRFVAAHLGSRPGTGTRCAADGPELVKHAT